MKRGLVWREGYICYQPSCPLKLYKVQCFVDPYKGFPWNHKDEVQFFNLAFLWLLCSLMLSLSWPVSCKWSCFSCLDILFLLMFMSCKAVNQTNKQTNLFCFNRMFKLLFHVPQPLTQCSNSTSNCYDIIVEGWGRSHWP